MRSFLIVFSLFFFAGTATGNGDLTLAPSPVDSLPAGTHRVSSYRNNQYTKATVSDGKISSLNIDGREVPSDSFSYYRPMVETLFDPSVRNRPLNDEGTKSNRIYKLESVDEQGIVFHEEYWEDLEENLEDIAAILEDIDIDIDLESLERLDNLEGFEDLEISLDDLEKDLEGLGENLEGLGEEIAASIERAFSDSDANSNVSVSIHRDGKKVVYDPKNNSDHVKVIDLEGRKQYQKAVMKEKKRLDKINRDKPKVKSNTDEAMDGSKIERTITETISIMKREGLMDDNWDKIKFNTEGYLYLDDELAPPATTARFLQLFQERIPARKGVNYSFEFDKNDL